MEALLPGFNLLFESLRSLEAKVKNVQALGSVAESTRDLIARYESVRVNYSNLSSTAEGSLKMQKDIQRWTDDVSEILDTFCSGSEAASTAGSSGNATASRRGQNTPGVLVRAGRHTKRERLSPSEAREKLESIKRDMDSNVVWLTAHGVADITSGMNDANLKLDTLVAGQNKDEWRKSWGSAPPRQDHMLGLELHAVQELKEAVLSSSGGNSVAAVGVKGRGGVGKTTAAIVIAHDQEVRNIFPDGILWMQLGLDSTAADVLKQLARVVEKTGGARVAKTIGTMKGEQMDEAASDARDWFDGHKVLLIIDNVFPSSEAGPDCNWMTHLVAAVSGESRILFTTRSESVALKANKRIAFMEMSAAEHSSQEMMFRKHLRDGTADSRSFDDEHARRILEKCHGLPLAIATAAALVRSKEYRWEEALRALEAATVVCLQGKFARLGKHEGLRAIFDAMLKELDQRQPSDHAATQSKLLRLPDGCTWSDVYISLAILDKSAPTVPIKVLAMA
jgi:hypothetical protein